MAKTATAESAAGTAKPPAPRKPRKSAPPKRLSREHGAKPPAGLTHEVITYLDTLWSANPAQLICLAYGHIWPILLPGRGRPQGWSAHWLGNGVFGIEEECTRDELGTGETCGRIRVSNTAQRGIFLDRDMHRQYKNTDDRWLIRPEDSRLTRRDVIDYLTWVMGDELFAGIQAGDGAIA